MKFALLLMFSLLIACASQNQMHIRNPNKFGQLMTTQQYKTISGVDENLLSLDIYYRNDTTLKKPVVIYVHGGAWITGDKAHQLSNKINLFDSLNYVFVSINYRLSPRLRSQSTPDRIKYPVHNRDVADAIKWVIEHISDYGGNQNRIALLGHSAGAHLVALTGTNKMFLEQSGYSLSHIKGVAAIDTEGYNVRAKVLEGSQIYINAFGIKEQENIDASPLFNIQSHETYPKFFIAKRGSAARMDYADAFIQKLTANNIETYQINASEYSHTGINQAIGYQNEITITQPLIDFFEKCFE